MDGITSFMKFKKVAKVAKLEMKLFVGVVKWSDRQGVARMQEAQATEKLKRDDNFFLQTKLPVPKLQNTISSFIRWNMD